jgi:hypothetical protein
MFGADTPQVLMDLSVGFVEALLAKIQSHSSYFFESSKIKSLEPVIHFKLTKLDADRKVCTNTFQGTREKRGKKKKKKKKVGSSPVPDCRHPGTAPPKARPLLPFKIYNFFPKKEKREERNPKKQKTSASKKKK